MSKYKLHSKAKDNSWFHFRENMDSLMQSFTISYLIDGTVVMSGDMGDLVWKRYGHGFTERKDYGFPNNETNIKYFDEKVIFPRKLKDWEYDRAIEELEELLKDEGWEENLKLYEKEKETGIYIDTQEEFINFLSNDLDLDCECYDIGEDYTGFFEHRFNMIKSVSDIIIEEVNK